MSGERRETCVECLTEELKPENVAPIHDDTRLFVDSQWTSGRLSCGYLAYRVVVATLIIAWMIVDFVTEAGGWYRYNYGIWFVFATNWSFIAVGISAVMMAVSTVYYYWTTRRRCLEYPTPIGWGLRVQWVMYNIAANSAIVVSISFWAFIIIFVNNDMSHFMTTSMSQLKHSLNTIYVVVDLFVNGTPIRIYHMIYPLLAGLVYSIFNAVYFTNDGRGPNGHPYAYDIMDWRNPFGSTVTCLLAFVVSCLVQFLLYGLYRARLAAYRRMNAVLAEEMAVGGGGGGGYRAPDIFVDDANCSETGPIFPNGLDRGTGVANVGYSSTADAVVLNDKGGLR